MSTTIAIQGRSDAVLPAEIVERVLVGGDLSKLNAGERLKYYLTRCEAAGLNPATRPFEYITLQGKLTLYATKSCTDSLAGIHGLSHEILERRIDKDLMICEVRCRVRFPDGRSSEDIGVLSIAGLKGNDLANALMKCVTKSKRRATLSICGLGDVIDETEIETVADAVIGDTRTEHHAVHHNNNTGHGSGAYAHPAAVKAFDEWLSTLVGELNAIWLDKHCDDNGEPLEGVKDLLNTWQVSGHLLKYARENQILKLPEKPAAAQRSKFLAVWFERDVEAIEREVRRYGRIQWRTAEANLVKPEDESHEFDDWDEAADVEAQDEPDSED